tara:strand:- start:115 stop:324 length:210 start_codon:yes stop_codon:yes gene_type:complete
MKKNNNEINLLDISQIEHRSKRSDKIKTTDINILLNRVRLSRKIEFKKKATFVSLLLLSIILVGIIYLI